MRKSTLVVGIGGGGINITNDFIKRNRVYADFYELIKGKSNKANGKLYLLLDEIPRFYTADIFRQCVNVLKTKPQMIIVDEIDYLLADFRTIETLRDLHDETGIPVILVGMKLARHKLKKHTHLFDRISEIYNFTEFEYADIKQIVEELAEVEITKEAIKLIHNKATSFRQIVQMIDNFEKVAQANSLNIIDENIASEVLNGGF